MNETNNQELFSKFIKLLSDLNQTSERARNMYEEIGKLAQDEDVKEAMQARAFVAQKNADQLTECFRLLGKKPVPLSGKLYQTFIEDFRKEISEIESPAGKRLYLLAKAMHLTHQRIGELVVLTAAADLTGHYGVGVLLESCLANKLAFVERTRRLIRARGVEIVGKNGKEMFVKLLSHLRYTAERADGIFKELSKLAEHEEVKEALEARVFVTEKNIAELDECFKLIDEKPVKLSNRLYETFAEDFRAEISQIGSPAAKRLFIVAKAIHLTHLRIGEFVVLIAATDAAGYHGVGLLLESCLADKLAFLERTRRLIRARVHELEMAQAA